MSIKPFMPEAEAAYLEDTYRQARVILEYGSGGSTRVAASLPDKFIMSVESDLRWARALRQDLVGEPSPVIIHHVNIGPVGRWGRPMSDAGWRVFHRYPNSVWDQTWFRAPDTVLIDGRFRTACFAAVMLKAKQTTRVLFDDYGVRESYRLVEQVIKPNQMIGRMAEFIIEPKAFRSTDTSFLIEQFFQSTVHGQGEEAYRVG